jgi:hypothetical protein
MSVDYIDLNDPTIVAGVVTTFGIIVVAVIGLIVAVLKIVYDNSKIKISQRITGQQISKIAENVVNDHPKNLREENDERHGENSERLTNIETTTELLVESQIDLTRGMNRIEDALQIERTIPRDKLAEMRKTKRTNK